MDADPCQHPAGELSPDGPDDQGQQEQGGGDPALTRLPGRLVGRLQLLDERAETLTVIGRQIEQGRPETRVEDAVGLLGHLRFQQAAADTGNLGNQLGGAHLQRGQGFELFVDLAFLCAEHVSLGGNGRGHQGVLVVGHRPQHIELRLQLRLPGQQRGGLAINFLDKDLHLILRAFQLGVVGGQGNLLLEAVELVLQAEQLAVGHADQRRCRGGSERVGHRRRRQPTGVRRQKRENDVDH
ncbi:hypothetical protein D3C76_849300 [compost metagenome]